MTHGRLDEGHCRVNLFLNVSLPEIRMICMLSANIDLKESTVSSIGIMTIKEELILNLMGWDS